MSRISLQKPPVQPASSKAVPAEGQERFRVIWHSSVHDAFAGEFSREELAAAARVCLRNDTVKENSVTLTITPR